MNRSAMLARRRCRRRSPHVGRARLRAGADESILLTANEALQDGKPVVVVACLRWQALRDLQRRAAPLPCCAAPHAGHPARAPAADASSGAVRYRDVAASAAAARRPSQGSEPREEQGGQQLGALRERHLAAPSRSTSRAPTRRRGYWQPTGAAMAEAAARSLIS